MREIKFRAKPVYKGGKTTPFVYGTFRYIPCNVIRPGATDNGRRELRNDKGVIIDSYYCGETEVLCDTVGQFTGLRDKNGKDIYEGDIVRTPYNGNREVKYECGEWQLVGSNCGWMSMGEIDGNVGIGSTMYNIEVIGNVCENPELINK